MTCGNNWFGNDPENGVPMWFILACAGVLLVLLFMWFAARAGY